MTATAALAAGATALFIGWRAPGAMLGAAAASCDAAVGSR